MVTLQCPEPAERSVGETFYTFRVYHGCQWDLTDIDQQKSGVWASALRCSCGMPGGMKMEHQFSFPCLGVTGALLGIDQETCVAIVIQRIKPSKKQISGCWLATRAVALIPRFRFLLYHIGLLNLLEKRLVRQELHTPEQWVVLSCGCLLSFCKYKFWDASGVKELEMNTFSFPCC